MTFPLGSLLGLPPGYPDVVAHAAAWRWVLVGVALSWALLAASGRPLRTVLGGVLFAEAALLFWTLGFARPYGLLDEPATTREAAFASVSASAGQARGIVARSSYEGGAWARLERLGVPARAVIELPTLLPLLVLPLTGVLVWRAWGAPAAALWLAFSTGDLDALRGAGFVPGLWGHPFASLGVAASIAGAGLVARARSRAARVVGYAACLAGAGAAVVGPDAGASPAGTFWLLATGDWPWPLLAAVGLWRGVDGGVWTLLVAGALPASAAGLGAPVDPWGPHALFRLGLILAAAPVVSNLAQGARAALARRLEARSGRWRYAARQVVSRSPGLGFALLLLIAVPGSCLTWWDPTRLDRAAYLSLEPLDYGLAAAMEWARRNTPADAVFVATEPYASAVPVLAGRQVLRAPALQRQPDERRRQRLEWNIVRPGERGAANVARYGVTHLLVAPGDLARWALPGFEAIQDDGRFQLVFQEPSGFRVYQLTNWRGASSRVGSS